MDEAHIAVDANTEMAHVVWTDDADLTGQVATCGVVSTSWIEIVADDGNLAWSWYPFSKETLCHDCFRVM